MTSDASTNVGRQVTSKITCVRSLRNTKYYFFLLAHMTLCMIYLTTYSNIPIRRQGIQIVSFSKWPIVQNNGAPTTHDKPATLMCPVYSIHTQEHFAWEEPVHTCTCNYLLLVILVGVRIKLAIPGSAVKPNPYTNTHQDTRTRAHNNI